MNRETKREETYYHVLESVMAGQGVDSIACLMKDLPEDDQQAMLCTLRYISDEIAEISQEHGNIVFQLLGLCRHCVIGEPLCMRRASTEDRREAQLCGS